MHVCLCARVHNFHCLSLSISISISLSLSLSLPLSPSLSELKAKAEAAKGKAKTEKPPAKTNIVLDVKGWGEETDMLELERCVREIEMDGL